MECALCPSTALYRDSSGRGYCKFHRRDAQQAALQESKIWDDRVLGYKENRRQERQEPRRYGTGWGTPGHRPRALWEKVSEQ